LGSIRGTIKRKEVIEMKELKLEIEELEERIAPSFVFDPLSQPTMARADPVGGGGGGGDQLTASFGADSTEVGTTNAWVVHGNRTTNSGVAFQHTPLDFGMTD
jgi:hypothetical protein